MVGGSARCPQCGAFVRIGTRVCPTCGLVLIAEPKKKRSRAGCALVAFLWTALFAATAWVVVDRGWVDVARFTGNHDAAVTVDDAPKELRDVASLLRRRAEPIAKDVGPGATSLALDEGVRVDVAASAFAKPTKLRATAFDVALPQLSAKARVYKLATDDEIGVLGAPVDIVVPFPIEQVRASRLETNALSAMRVSALDATHTKIAILHFSENGVLVKVLSPEWWESQLAPGHTPQRDETAKRIVDVGNDGTKHFYGVGERSKRSHEDMCKDMLDVLSRYNFAGDNDFPKDYPGGIGALRVEFGEMKEFFMASESPSKTLYKGQPTWFYAKVADSTRPGGPIETTLMAAAKASPTGQASMGQLLSICIDANGGSVPLGVLACHNYLKELTHEGRNHTATKTIDRASNTVVSDQVPDSIAAPVNALEPWRGEGDRSPAGDYDKMGPLYHVFAAMAISLWSTGGAFGSAAVDGEWVLRMLHMGEDVPDWEKGVADTCGESVSLEWKLKLKHRTLVPGERDAGALRDAAPDAHAYAAHIVVQVLDDWTDKPLAGAHFVAHGFHGEPLGAGASGADGRVVVPISSAGVEFIIAHVGCDPKTVKFPRGTGALPSAPIPIKLKCHLDAGAAPPSTSPGTPHCESGLMSGWKPLPKFSSAATPSPNLTSFLCNACGPKESMGGAITIEYACPTDTEAAWKSKTGTKRDTEVFRTGTQLMLRELGTRAGYCGGGRIAEKLFAKLDASTIATIYVLRVEEPKDFTAQALLGWAQSAAATSKPAMKCP